VIEGLCSDWPALHRWQLPLLELKHASEAQPKPAAGGATRACLTCRLKTRLRARVADVLKWHSRRDAVNGRLRVYQGSIKGLGTPLRRTPLLRVYSINGLCRPLRAT
jgi:hypothetical protein